MSASYEQRKELVTEVLEARGPWPISEETVEAVLDALDHIPENVGWVCQGQPRDPVSKRAA